VPAGLEATCQVLSTTRNKAVLPVVVAGIHSSSPEVRAAVIRAALRRHDAATHTQLVRHFHELDAEDQAVFCDAHRAMPHHAASVLRKAVLEGDAAHCGNACAIIRGAGDFDQFSTLINAAENNKHHHLEIVVAAIAGLADSLHRELARWASGARDGGRDPSFVRHHALTTLEQSLGRFAQHRRIEILDAFLLLAPIDNTTFLRILRDPHHACHAKTVAALSTSEDSGIMERLVELLRDTEAPDAALEIVAKRGDQQFLNILLHELKHPAPLRVLHNMNRMQSVVWLESRRAMLLDLDGRAQAVAIDLALASSMSDAALFNLFSYVLQNGLAEGRRASCQALGKFINEDAGQLIRTALNDPDSGVEAAAVRQLRPRKLPDALKLLVSRLDSPAVEVRDAVRSSLAEFNFDRYKAMFDLLDEEAARTTGRLVHKVDQSTHLKLLEELSSPSVSTRLRAIEMAVAMAAADDIYTQLTELARHENAAVREEAVLALAHCHRPGSLHVLATATHDPNGMVAEAARASLGQLQQVMGLSHAEQSPTTGRST
jgi:HEAT repeat protein